MMMLCHVMQCVGRVDDPSIRFLDLVCLVDSFYYRNGPTLIVDTKLMIVLTSIVFHFVVSLIDNPLFCCCFCAQSNNQ
jgi:hypothetical protein